MNINPMGTSSSNINTNFNGTLKIKGRWSEYMMNKFKEDPSVKEALKNNSIFANMKMRTSSGRDMLHYQGQAVYKLCLSSKKDKPGFFDKIKYAVGLNPKASFTRAFHSKEGTEALLSNRCRLREVLTNKLKIQI